jgi:hypothetical protein
VGMIRLVYGAIHFASAGNGLVVNQNRKDRVMFTVRIVRFAAASALSLGVGTAMAQEGPNDTASGAAYFGNQVHVIQSHGAIQGAVQSGTSDTDMRPSNGQWQPGYNVNNEGSSG